MCAIKCSHAATLSASWQKLTGVPQLLYFVHLLSPSFIQSQNIVCQCGEDVLMSSTLIRSLLAACAQQHRAPQIRRDRATLQEYKNVQQLTDRVPIKEILREPAKSRLRSRRPFVIEAARLANLNQTDQEIWEQSWIQGEPPGHNLVTNPTCPQLGFTLPRRQFVTLNRLRCGQARSAESLPMGCDHITFLPLRREPP